jgi:probable Rubsico expression protein CbbX
MWGVRAKYFKTGGVLFVATVGLVLAGQFLPRIAFFFVLASLVLVIVIALASRDAWRQTTQRKLDQKGYVLPWEYTDPGMRRDWAPFLKMPGAGAGRIVSGKPATRKPVTRKPVTGAPATGRPAAGKPMAARAAGRSRFRRRGGDLLQPEALVTLVEERRAAGIDDLFTALDQELIGLVPVKKKVEEIGSLLLVDRARQRFGLSASRPNLHMCFTGAPGTGKTTVALKLADLLRRLGYLENGHLVHAMRDDLVGEYIGHTAPKTKAVLDRAMGGVLFIDEAYSLYRAQDSKDYGQECIDILLQVMENDRDKLVVILAGYKDRMDNFFESNPGMSSRIAHHLDFAEYTLDELLAIGQLMLDQSSYYLSGDADEAFRDFLSAEMRQPRFANARSVRNELERARLRHAYRLAAEPERNRSKDDLMRLEAADIALGAALPTP